MQIPKEDFQRIEAMIHSDASPVGIDAKSTHVYIIHLLEKLSQRIETLENELKKRPPA